MPSLRESLDMIRECLEYDQRIKKALIISAAYFILSLVMMALQYVCFSMKLDKILSTIPEGVSADLRDKLLDLYLSTLTSTITLLSGLVLTIALVTSLAITIMWYKDKKNRTYALIKNKILEHSNRE